MKGFRIALMLVLSVPVITGCAGNLYTHTNPESACILDENDKCTGTYRGIFVRPLKMVEEFYILDRILASDGKVTHFMGGPSGQACLPINMSEKKLVADPDNAHIVEYDPAFFETAEFSIALSPLGTVTSAGTKTTPGGKALVEAFTGLATTVKTLNHGAVSSAEAKNLTGKDVTPVTMAIPACSHGRLIRPE